MTKIEQLDLFYQDIKSKTTQYTHSFQVHMEHSRG